MIKKNRTTLQFMLGGILMLTMAVTACNNGKEESKDAPKDSVTTAPPPPSAVKDSIDTMESKTGNVAPGNDTKPVSPAP